MGAYFGGERFVAAGYPVFLFPVLLDHVMSFLVARSHSIYHIGAIHTKEGRFNAWQRIHILVCTDWLVLSEVYISLFVRIGLFCPNKVLTPVYEWSYFVLLLDCWLNRVLSVLL